MLRHGQKQLDVLDVLSLQKASEPIHPELSKLKPIDLFNVYSKKLGFGEFTQFTLLAKLHGLVGVRFPCRVYEAPRNNIRVERSAIF